MNPDKPKKTPENDILTENTLKRRKKEKKSGTETNQPPSIFMNIQPVKLPKVSEKNPELPVIDTSNYGGNREMINRHFSADKILYEIATIINNWQNELTDILAIIPQIYAEGPMIDGWLESDTGEVQIGDAKLRYIHELNNPTNIINHYRVCGVDEHGNMWTYPCPDHEIQAVRIAIARYQKMCQLLERKQYLQTRLNQITQTLTVIHSHIS